MSAELVEWASRELGLDPRLLDARELAAVAARLGASSPSALADRLPTDSALAARFVDAVVVGETWLFRDPDVLAFVRDHAVALGRARVLSLPASTGEEPLSLAAMLADAGLSGRASIDAVDVSQAAVARAARGVFGSSSLRGGLPDAHAARFTPCDGGVRVDPEVAAMVSLRVGNALEPATLPPGPYDVVMCRNLLIHLHESARVRVVADLVGRLTPTGLLVVGAGETPAFGGALRREPSAPACVWRRVVVASAPAVVPLPAPPRDVPPTVPPPPRATLERARELADRGLADEARAALAAHEAEVGPSSAMYLLKALLALRDDPRAAEESLRRALYLDPHDEEALDHLSRLLEREGLDGGAAVRARLSRVRARKGGRAG